MFQGVFRDLVRNPPVITLTLIASCLITTIPQFFLGPGYDALTGDTSTRNIAFFPLVSFSHDPKILLAHLSLNVSVFLFFGSVLERVLGKDRFALLTLTTFLTSTALVFFRGTPSHGASGVCWGYQAFLAFILIAYSEKEGARARTDPWLRFYAGFMAFNYVGTPVFEAFSGVRLGDNFGQYVHLASTVVAVPFLLRWRHDIETRLAGTHAPEDTRTRGTLPVIMLFALALYNAVATAIAACVSRAWP